MANIFEIAIDNFDKINKYFRLNLTDNRRFWRGQCPLHQGDNTGSIVIYKSGHSTTGSWKCYTQGCHEKYGKSILGFIKGLLTQKYSKNYNNDEVMQWCEQIFQIKVDDIQGQTLDDNLTKLTNKIDWTPTFSFKITEEEFLNKLQQPVKYFLDRGFEEKTLDYFKLGLCNDPTKPLYSRAIVPHYDNNGQYIIACLGRIIYEKCNACNNYHDTKKICRTSPKWKNSNQFPSTTSLYNYHRSKQNIQKHKIAILTEGVGNVWRMWEAGIHLSLSCFGINFSSVQKNLLDGLGVETIIIVPDADEAGTNLINNIKKECLYTHNIVIIEPKYKNDIADANIETTKQLILPIIEKYV